MSLIPYICLKRKVFFRIENMYIMASIHEAILQSCLPYMFFFNPDAVFKRIHITDKPNGFTGLKNGTEYLMKTSVPKLPVRGETTIWR